MSNSFGLRDILHALTYNSRVTLYLFIYFRDINFLCPRPRTYALRSEMTCVHRPSPAPLACRQPKCLMSRLAKIEQVSMRSNRPSSVMPAQRHPAALRAGIPSSPASTSFLRAFSEKDVDGRDKPSHDAE
jgi:hypothetical protein